MAVAIIRNAAKVIFDQVFSLKCIYLKRMNFLNDSNIFTNNGGSIDQNLKGFGTSVYQPFSKKFFAFFFRRMGWDGFPVLKTRMTKDSAVELFYPYILFTMGALHQHDVWIDKNYQRL